MVKPEWGTKRICLNCGARFYDMQREPIVCPACGTAFDPTAHNRPRRARAAPKAAAVATVELDAEEAIVEDEEVEAEAPEAEDEEEVAGAADEAEEAEDDSESAIEDVSELGDDDMADVIDTELEDDDSER